MVQRDWDDLCAYALAMLPDNSRSLKHVQHYSVPNLAHERAHRVGGSGCELMCAEMLSGS